MTLKTLAYAAHGALQTQAGCEIRHSHIYELLAAAFGYKTWASLRTDALLADHGVGQAPSGAAAPQVAGRALQLQYGQPQALAMADTLAAFVAGRQLGVVRWASLTPLLATARSSAHLRDDAEDDEGDEDPDGWDEEPRPSTTTAAVAPREHFLASDLLLSCLEQAASVDPRAHLILATFYRCARPNPYLYEESLKGRQLTASERGWVEEYLKRAPQYQRYEAHLKAAAEAGVRAAALEYGMVFESPAFIALAERLDGDVDPEQMAQVASSPEARTRWLRQAAEAGSRRALEELADLGDPWAEERMAPKASLYWLRSMAERALNDHNPVRAWVWQYVALARGDDLTRSTLVARHEGGSNHGEFYDSDFGGPLYVDGEEGLALPELERAHLREAKAQAQRIILRH
nr:hypothetical protein [Delftia acidovorans]